MREYPIRKHGAGNRAHWTVKLGRRVHGDYLSLWAALLDAVDAAHEDGERGRDAEVLIEREDGAAERAWRFGGVYPLMTMPASNDNAEAERCSA